MTVLLPQIFLLMLAAFLLGAMLACFARTLLFGARSPAPIATRDAHSQKPAQPGASASSPAIDRFTRALTSAGGMPKDALPAPVPVETPAAKPQPKMDSAPLTMAAAVAAARRGAEVPAAPREQAAKSTPQPAGAAMAPAAPPPAPKPEPKADLTPPEPVQSPAVAKTPPLPSAPIAPSIAAEPHQPAAPRVTASVAQSATGFAAALVNFDDLTRIRGIDAAAAAKLVRLGISKFEQIARWRPDDVARANRELGARGRAEQQNWIEQAAILAKGGQTAFTKDKAASAPTPDKPAETARAAQASAAATVVTSASAVAPPLSSPAKKDSAPASSEARSDLSGLRSVKSGASSYATARVAAGPDDLKRIRGIGVLIEKRLNALGVANYEQIANWTSADIDRVGRALEIESRIGRENWVEQARILASGGQTAFSRREG